jgi:hypothetical protein
MRQFLLPFQIPAHLQKMLPFSALQAANHQAALAAAACLPQQLAQMQAAAAAQHYNSLSASQMSMSPTSVTSLGGQHGVTGTAMPTYTGGPVYAATPTLTQAQALSALSHHHQVNGLVSTVPTMALSPSLGSVTLAHPAAMQKLLSLPPPKVRINSWHCIHNTSFSLLLATGPNKLECYITSIWKGLPGTNTISYQAHS